MKDNEDEPTTLDLTDEEIQALEAEREAMLNNSRTRRESNKSRPKPRGMKRAGK